MRAMRVIGWTVAALAAAAAVGGGILAWQMRRSPPPNAFYVALGSSFAAGLGLGRRAPGSPIASMRTVNGYPQQLARLLKVPSFTDMTSSGSTVRHVLHGGQMLLGPQVNALGPDTRLVTLTAGGNDVGYVGDLTAMAYRHRGGAVGAAIGMLWDGPRSIAKRDFDALAADLVATLGEIRRRSPRARIVVATYPSILPLAGTCPRLGITAEEADAMREVADRLAETTRNAAAGSGAIVVDMATLSAGHDACATKPWVNGFMPALGADFHPTLAGATATAQVILAALPSE